MMFPEGTVLTTHNDTGDDLLLVDPQPYTSGRDQLRDYLHLLTLYLQRYINRFSHRLIDAGGTLDDLFVSVHEASTLLHNTPFPSQNPEPLPFLTEAHALNDTILHHRALMRARLIATPDTLHLPIEDLRATAHLDEHHIILLLAAAAPSISIDLSRLYTFAWADFTIKHPTVGFITELLADTHHDHALDLLHALRDSTLIRQRLVLLSTHNDAWGPHAPLIHQSVHVPERVIAFLLEQHPPLHTAISDACNLDPAHTAIPTPQLILPEDTLSSLHAAIHSALRHRNLRIALIGPQGSGRRTALRAAIAELGRDVITLDLDLLDEDDAFEDKLADCCREALLRQAALLVRMDALSSDDTRLTRRRAALRARLLPFEGILAFATTTPSGFVSRTFEPLFEVLFPIPSTQQQRQLWQRTCDTLDVHLHDHDIDTLTQRFHLTPGQIHEATHEARAKALVLHGHRRARNLDIEALTRALRARADHRLATLATPFPTRHSWADLVLSHDLRDRLEEIITHARFREKVFDTWGLADKMRYGHGLSCLFSGPPGCGKTMTAAILAKEIGREIYRVDLSRIVSKWVGETERNLSAAFDEAQKAQVVLLFDEADALFSKRTRGSGANDRYANMEINHLLQRMEAYDGVTILTTNTPQNLDEAFLRRLKFKLHFPLPDASLRARMWQHMLPPRANIQDDIDFDTLAEHFDLPGGHIRNAILRAAMEAANTDERITFDKLWRAAVLESKELGKVVCDLPPQHTHRQAQIQPD